MLELELSSKMSLKNNQKMVQIWLINQIIPPAPSDLQRHAAVGGFRSHQTTQDLKAGGGRTSSAGTEVRGEGTQVRGEGSAKQLLPCWFNRGVAT